MEEKSMVQRDGGADKKLDSPRAPRGAGSQCIHKIKLTLHDRSTTSAVP